jgi:N-acetylneuraminic acid mutarotase
MYVIGGYIGEVTACALKFDSLLDTWSEVANLPEVRYAMTACAVESDVFVFGGYDTQYQAQVSIFKFDTIDNIWSILAPMPQACCTHSTTLLDGLVNIFGAGDSRQEVLQFNPTTEVWTTLAHTSIRREQAMSFVLGGRLYSEGGTWGGSTVERYNVASNSWEAVADMHEGRQLCGAVTIKSFFPEEQGLFDLLITKAAGRSHI